jgi:DNA-binding phage protein
MASSSIPKEVWDIAVEFSAAAHERENEVIAACDKYLSGEVAQVAEQQDERTESADEVFCRDVARLVRLCECVANKENPESVKSAEIFRLHRELDGLEEVAFTLLVLSGNWPNEIRSIEAAWNCVKRGWAQSAGIAEENPVPAPECPDGQLDSKEPAPECPEDNENMQPICDAPKRKNKAWVHSAIAAISQDVESTRKGNPPRITSMSAIAREVGVSSSTVSRYLETNKDEPFAKIWKMHKASQTGMPQKEIEDAAMNGVYKGDLHITRNT